jgi:FtsZ-interacting cell division protein ZipA
VSVIALRSPEARGKGGGTVDMSTIIWIIVGVIALVALVAVIAWVATSGRRREAQLESRRRESEELREKAAETDAAAREREVKAMRADAAARQAQADAAAAQLEAERLEGAGREHRTDAERLRAEEAEQAQRAAAVDPDSRAPGEARDPGHAEHPATDEHGNPLTHPAARDDQAAASARGPVDEHGNAVDTEHGDAPRHSRGV